MKRKNWILGMGILVFFVSCEKEYSIENSGNNDVNGLIVGADCRISKIVTTDTANKGVGSIAADINNLDVVTRINLYDSLSATLDYQSMPVIANDTIYINDDEYFIVDINKRILSLHGLTDPTDPLSPQFDESYFYNANGYLGTKFYAFTVSPGTPVYITTYTHIGGNLTHMSRIHVPSGDLDMDADLSYFNNIFPRRYLYLFSDVKAYPYFTQFYNFGTRPTNAIKNMVVRNYDPGNTVRDSLVSSFSNYIMSRDTYVLSVQMGGDDQPSIPAAAGKLSFSYKCK